MDQAQLAVTVVGVIGAVVGLWYAGQQLHNTRQSIRGEFLLTLDQAFVRHAAVHGRLRPGGDWEGSARRPDNMDEWWAVKDLGPKDSEWLAVEEYMGLFERIEVLIDGGSLDAALVNRLYGYRVFNIVANSEIRTKKLIDLAEGRQDFIKLKERLEAEGRWFAPLTRTRPQPLPEPRRQVEA